MSSRDGNAVLDPGWLARKRAERAAASPAVSPERERAAALLRELLTPIEGTRPAPGAWGAGCALLGVLAGDRAEAALLGVALELGLDDGAQPRPNDVIPALAAAAALCAPEALPEET